MRLAKNGNSVLNHTQHDTTDAMRDVDAAIRTRTSYEIDANVVRLGDREYFVNAHDPRAYRTWGMPFPHRTQPERLDPWPMVHKLAAAETFVKIDLKSPLVIDRAIELMRAIPEERRMAHAFVDVLAFNRDELRPWEQDELVSLDDVDRVRRELGDPSLVFELGCRGVTEEKLTPSFADEIVRLAGGRANVISFFLPDGANVRPEIARRLWLRHGLLTTVRIRSKEEKAAWDRLGIPYLGTTDDPSLATAFA